MLSLLTNKRYEGVVKTAPRRVKDYSKALKSIGYDTKLFIKGNTIEPEFSVAAKNQIDELKRLEADRLGISVELSDDVIKETMVFKENEAWAKFLVDNGYTVINIGNPNSIVKTSPFYEMERLTIFGF